MVNQFLFPFGEKLQKVEQKETFPKKVSIQSHHGLLLKAKKNVNKSFNKKEIFNSIVKERLLHYIYFSYSFDY